MSKEPLLGVAAVREKIKFPVLASPKLDGIRCLRVGNRNLSRKFIELPNRHIAEVLRDVPEGLDGELIVPPAVGTGVYTRTQSVVMSRDKVSGFIYYVFDLHNFDAPFSTRLDAVHDLCTLLNPELPVVPLGHILLNNLDELDRFEEQMVEAGYEGIMLRDPHGKYKWGRSTVNQGLLLKVKRWEDSEARITGMIELQHNQNEATVDKRGRTTRSSHKAGKVPGRTMGKLLGTDIHTGEPVEVGSGFTRSERDEFWAMGQHACGMIFTYKFIPYGVKDKPRHPIYKGLRNEIDL